MGYFEILRPMDCTLNKIPWEVAFAGKNFYYKKFRSQSPLILIQLTPNAFPHPRLFAHFTCVDYLMKLSILHAGKSFMEFSWQFCLKYYRLAQNCSHIFRDKPLYKNITLRLSLEATFLCETQYC